MATKEERVKYFDRKKFEIENEGFIELMEISLKESFSTAVVEGKVRFEALQRMYKEFYIEGNKMTPAFKEEFARHAHTLKGQSGTCMIDLMYLPSKKLQTAIDNSVREDIDKYMYEVFAAKKKYLECLEALQDHMVDEPEFDLRLFDEFTGLNFAHLYQQIPPITANSITFNQISAGISKQEERKDTDGKDTRPRVLISETVTFPAEPSKEEEKVICAGAAKEAKKKQFEDASSCFAQVSEMKVYEDSIYTLSRESRDKAQSLYATRRAANLADDFPFDTQLSCMIF